MAFLSAMVLCALLLASVAPAATFAQSSIFATAKSCDGSDGVYLYDEEDYEGDCVRLTGDVSDLSDISFNNIASSIRFEGDWTATLFTDQDYEGSSSTFENSDPNLSNNSIDSNRASSIRILSDDVDSEHICNGKDGVYLYEDEDYEGDCIRLTSDENDLSDLSFNNKVSSIRTEGDWTVVLYVDQDYGGTSSTFTGDDSDIGDTAVGEDSASSIRVQKGTTPVSYGDSCDGGEGVYLYEHANYAGYCIKLTSTAPDLRVYSFDDMASSLRVVGSWTAVLYRDLNGTGLSSSYTADDSNLADDGIGDNQATSVVLWRGGSSGGGSGGGSCDGGEGVYLYADPNYAGNCIKLSSDAPDMRVYGFDDTASSVRVVGSWTAVLYRDLSSTGVSSAFSADDPNLADNAIGDNQVTSVSVQRGGLPSGNACDGGEGAYLYENANYTGRCLKLTQTVIDLRIYGFDDMTSSLRIVGNWQVRLFRDLSGAGISSTYTQDDSNMGDDGVGDNQATSVSLERR